MAGRRRPANVSRSDVAHTGAAAAGLPTDGATALAPAPLPKDRTNDRTSDRRSRGGGPGGRAPLRVARPPRQVKKSRNRRSQMVLGSFGLFVLSCGVAAVAISMHGNLAERQLELDRLRSDVTKAERENQVLRADVAALEAPARIVNSANSMGLVPAEDVSFVASAAPLVLGARSTVQAPGAASTVGATGP